MIHTENEPIDTDEDVSHLGFLGYDDAIEHVLTPLWREAVWGFEWAQLRLSPVFYGIGVPHGRGEPVLVIPGFMAGDLLMLEMHRWLKRIGYRSSLSRIPWNNDCPDLTGRKLLHRVRRLYERTGKRVNLVGHSLGGMLARSIVQEVPEYVDRVVTLGSPFRSLVKAHPAVVGIWDKLKLAQGGLIGRNLHASCGTGHCTCTFVRNMSLPKAVDVPQYAIYSRNDGVADWSSCIEDDPSMNREVSCTHIGMAVHAGVYRELAGCLAAGRTGA
ncbi:MAG: alpha/beta fold hydrolase [Gammaproteobacteria bacterium]|nr:alpha/beta fold hydrolase [Gammaproteobacteria bacterium]MCP5198819.1 alpha/beta fold hydrolase [Gammaproteobacteria bacterium]